MNEFDIRPGELGLRVPRRVVASSALHRQGIGAMYLYLLEPGPVYLIDAPIAADFRDQDHAVEIVDADRGELPTVLPPSDANRAREWLRGPRPPSHAERVKRLVNDYALPRASLGECVVRLVDEGGYGEETAVEIVREMYDQAIAQQLGRREPWLAEVEHLLAQVEAGASP